MNFFFGNLPKKSNLSCTYESYQSKTKNSKVSIPKINQRKNPIIKLPNYCYLFFIFTAKNRFTNKNNKTEHVK